MGKPNSIESAPTAAYQPSTKFRTRSNGTRISVDPFTESLATYPLSKDTVAFYQSWPKSECTDQTKLERSNWLGYDVRKVYKDLPGPRGTRTSLELLEAVALGCFALQDNWTLSAKEAVERRLIR